MKIIIVDDCRNFLEGLEYFLSKNLECIIVGKARNGEEYLKLLEKNNPELVLLDIKMPEMGGLEAAKLSLWEYPHLKIIAITMYLEKAYLRELLDAGFKGCVLKTDIYEKLPKAIKEVSSGNYFFSEDVQMLSNRK
ncbi:MAG: response regulator transcription factor [Bacteroidales bacterium]|nr:response regulator transcription factor [Bacteroidales bacterium]